MVISQGPRGDCLMASRHVRPMASEPSLFLHEETQMKSLKQAWQSDMQRRLMHLAPIKMLEEKRV